MYSRSGNEIVSLQQRWGRLCHWPVGKLVLLSVVLLEVAEPVDGDGVELRTRCAAKSVNAVGRAEYTDFLTLVRACSLEGIFFKCQQEYVIHSFFRVL